MRLRFKTAIDDNSNVSFFMVCRHLLFESRDLGLLRQIVALKFHIFLLQLHNLKFEIASVFTDWQIRRLDRQLEALRKAHGELTTNVK